MDVTALVAYTGRTGHSGLSHSSNLQYMQSVKCRNGCRGRRCWRIMEPQGLVR